MSHSISCSNPEVFINCEDTIEEEMCNIDRCHPACRLPIPEFDIDRAALSTLACDSHQHAQVAAGGQEIDRFQNGGLSAVVLADQEIHSGEPGKAVLLETTIIL